MDEENRADLAVRRSKSSVVGDPLVVGDSDILSGRLGSMRCGHRLRRIEDDAGSMYNSQFSL